MDELIERIAQRRGITRQQARERIAAMPGGQELRLDLVPLELSTLAGELLADDPGIASMSRTDSVRAAGDTDPPWTMR